MPVRVSVSTVRTPPVLLVTAASFCKKVIGSATAPLVNPLKGISVEKEPLRSITCKRSSIVEFISIIPTVAGASSITSSVSLRANVPAVTSTSR